MTSKKTVQDKTFEQNMQALQELLGKLETGNMPLEDSLKAFEEGQVLVQKCREKLAQAELRVQKIVDAHTGETEPFDA